MKKLILAILLLSTIAQAAYNPNNPNGSASSSASAPVVIAKDQSQIPTVNNAPLIMSAPTSNSMAALNATVQYSLEAQSNYYISLTNAPGATTTWVGTVNFEYSTNGGSSWSALTAMPSALPASSANATSATANGLWLIETPAGVGSQIMLVRANMSAYTSGTVYFFATPAAINNKIPLPWTYTVTGATTLMAPIEASGVTEINVQISAVTSTALTAQGTNDPTGTTWQTLGAQDSTIGTSVGSATMTAAVTYRVGTLGYKYVRIQCTTTGTVLTIQGITGTLGNSITLSGFGNAVAVSGGTIQTVTNLSSVTSITAAQIAIPGIIADVASAAITTTTTTATLVPTFGATYKVSIPVTAVSGTNPTMDVQIQESSDTGTNWYPVYDFPRITATGFYQSPTIPLTGNRVRYVQTIGGTTPSFTRAINRLQSSWLAADRVRQQFDRTISLTTLNSTTPSLNVAGTTNAQLVINIGAATTPPAIQLEGSDDGSGWYALGSPLTAVASSTVQLTVSNVQTTFLRARISTVGATVTAGYVLIKGF